MANQKTKHTWTYEGVTYTSLEALCQSTGANYDRVYYRVRHGWTLIDAITAPIYSREPIGLARKTLARIKDALKIRDPERAVDVIENILEEHMLETTAQCTEKDSCEPDNPNMPMILPAEAAQYLREYKQREDSRMESARIAASMSDEDVMNNLDALLKQTE